jgi:hypothetical protein
MSLIKLTCAFFLVTAAADGDPSQDHAGIRWYELRMTTRGRTGSPWGIYQQGTYAPDANDRWLGSIAMHRMGNIALGFNVSGTMCFRRSITRGGGLTTRWVHCRLAS